MQKIDIHQKHLVIIMGMHRSGTSLTARKLEQFGYKGSENFIPANKFNEDGYFEDARVVELHEQLLDHFDRTWGHFSHWLPLPDFWTDDAKAQTAKKRIKEIVANYQHHRFYIKDPRIVIFFKLWKQALIEENIKFSIVCIFRDEVAVAKSLAKRDKFKAEYSNALTRYYHSMIIEQTAGMDVIYINYEGFQNNESELDGKLSDFLGTKLILPEKIFKNKTGLLKGKNSKLNNKKKCIVSFSKKDATNAQKYIKKQLEFMRLYDDLGVEKIFSNRAFRLKTDLINVKSSLIDKRSQIEDLKLINKHLEQENEALKSMNEVLTQKLADKNANFFSKIKKLF